MQLAPRWELRAIVVHSDSFVCRPNSSLQYEGEERMPACSAHLQPRLGARHFEFGCERGLERRVTFGCGCLVAGEGSLRTGGSTRHAAKEE